MRELFMGRKQILSGSMEYYLLVEEQGGLCENYGIRIDIGEEQESVRGITLSQTRILSLLAMVMKGGITPSCLRDVVEDWLLA